MGESIAEGTIVRWIKKVGDAVDRDEPLFEISTDKVDAEIPSPAAGVLTEIKVKEGETVPVNSVVALIGQAGAAVATAPQPAASRPAASQPAASHPAPSHAAPPQPASAAARSSAPTVVPITDGHRSARRRARTPTPRPLEPSRLFLTTKTVVSVHRHSCDGSHASTTSTCRSSTAQGWADVSPRTTYWDSSGIRTSGIRNQESGISRGQLQLRRWRHPALMAGTRRFQPCSLVPRGRHPPRLAQP